MNSLVKRLILSFYYINMKTNIRILAIKLIEIKRAHRNKKKQINSTEDHPRIQFRSKRDVQRKD